MPTTWTESFGDVRTIDKTRCQWYVLIGPPATSQVRTDIGSRALRTGLWFLWDLNQRLALAKSQAVH